MLPLAPWYSAVTAVTPALTPTTTPLGLAVAVFELPVAHVTPGLDVMSSFVPFGSVASADICNESLRPTPHGDGEIAIAEIVEDEVDEPPHAIAASAARLAMRPNFTFGCMVSASRKACAACRSCGMAPSHCALRPFHATGAAEPLHFA